MSPLLAAALLDLGIKLEPAIADALGVAIKQIADDFRSPTFAEISRATVLGIERDHPEWPGDQKRRYAFDAIARTVLEDGTLPTDGAVNRSIEVFATWPCPNTEEKQ